MKLFGTDGVRGVAGDKLTEELAWALGRAVTEHCDTPRPQGLIVRDTRESGPMLERALAEGIASAGGEALMAGVLPTPAASILVRRLGLDFAAVVSASHNPWRDNGIKYFDHRGLKLDHADEAAIEQRVLEVLDQGRPAAGAAGAARTLHGALDDYLRELASVFRLNLAGLRVVLDCANGATHEAAPVIFERLGADVETIAAEPDGRNINEGCGSTHPEALRERVLATGAALGFAFDGDGDRVVAVDGAGRIRDGDELIALAAAHLRAAGELPGPGVVVTVMSNFGFHRAMEEAGIAVATTSVGDRHVSAELRAREWALGGEQSGHLIWTEFAPTGDGVAAALLTLRALGDRPLADAQPMERLPQVLRNVEVADRDAAAGSGPLAAAVERENDTLAGRGRVLVRASGTEPLLRVMVEAPTEEEADEVCGRLVGLVERELG
ncbi:MAG TPA: phosphoglucosamine mutase [Solirubrobacterales bacterium]|nr:phosphoglucosamine mutase [Solirubrobacterales bacterium]